VTFAVYIVAATKPWNASAFQRRTVGMAGKWHFIARPDELTAATIENLSPRYIFFPHWSWRVPREIFERFECVCFHMTDLPYGRGGSPLQNLIVRGHTSTMLTALRMVEELDAGPVYLKRPLSLAGRAEEIFKRAAELTYDLIAEIISTQPRPVPQQGEVVLFRRRSPDQSRIPQNMPINSLYDFIRMLDAPSYPKAFMELGELRLEFDHARLAASDVIEARVSIRKTTCS
jgi:methionyl-tRNA formyltransferase